MKIIIAGSGKIGYAVADILCREGHDVTVVDSDGDMINSLSGSLDVICVEGSATSAEVLTEAGAADADLLLAATRSDELNMVCGISARKLGTKHIIARIRDTSYLRQTDFLREALGLDVIINPELECAKEIARILRFPSAMRVDTFSTGSLEIVGQRLKPESKLCGMKLSDLRDRFKAKVLVSVAERGGKASIPDGDFVLQAGDQISVTGRSSELRRFFIAAGEYRKPIRSAMIMGGGRIAVHLAKMLLESGMSVTVVEQNRTRCEDLCGLIPDARIICGDATSSTVLLEEGIRKTDAFVALTGDDGSNIITSMYAKSCNVRKIVVKANREYYSEIMHSAGLDSVVTPKALISQQLARYVRAMSDSKGSSMETLYRLSDGQVEALEFKVAEGSACIGIPLKDMKLRSDVLICALVRGNRTIIPDGSTTIEAGDHAVLVTSSGWLKTLDMIVEG